MNGPGMFKVKPYYDYSTAQIELPSCMFKMKNVHDTSLSSQNGQEEQEVSFQNQTHESSFTSLVTRLVHV